jgi:hypothetical protein
MIWYANCPQTVCSQYLLLFLLIDPSSSRASERITLHIHKFAFLGGQGSSELGKPRPIEQFESIRALVGQLGERDLSMSRVASESPDSPSSTRSQCDDVFKRHQEEDCGEPCPQALLATQCSHSTIQTSTIAGNRGSRNSTMNLRISTKRDDAQMDPSKAQLLSLVNKSSHQTCDGTMLQQVELDGSRHLKILSDSGIAKKDNTRQPSYNISPRPAEGGDCTSEVEAPKIEKENSGTNVGGWSQAVSPQQPPPIVSLQNSQRNKEFARRNRGDEASSCDNNRGEYGVPDGHPQAPKDQRVLLERESSWLWTESGGSLPSSIITELQSFYCAQIVDNNTVSREDENTPRNNNSQGPVEDGYAGGDSVTEIFSIVDRRLPYSRNSTEHSLTSNRGIPIQDMVEQQSELDQPSESEISWSQSSGPVDSMSQQSILTSHQVHKQAEQESNKISPPSHNAMSAIDESSPSQSTDFSSIRSPFAESGMRHHMPAHITGANGLETSFASSPGIDDDMDLALPNALDEGVVSCEDIDIPGSSLGTKHPSPSIISDDSPILQVKRTPYAHRPFPRIPSSSCTSTAARGSREPQLECLTQVPKSTFEITIPGTFQTTRSSPEGWHFPSLSSNHLEECRPSLEMENPYTSRSPMPRVPILAATYSDRLPEERTSQNVLSGYFEAQKRSNSNPNAKLFTSQVTPQHDPLPPHTQIVQGTNLGSLPGTTIEGMTAVCDRISHSSTPTIEKSNDFCSKDRILSPALLIPPNQSLKHTSTSQISSKRSLGENILASGNSSKRRRTISPTKMDCLEDGNTLSMAQMIKTNRRNFLAQLSCTAREGTVSRTVESILPSVYERFKCEYSDYHQSMMNFVRACVYLNWLKARSQAPHRCLWDDFVRAWCTEYNQYVELTQTQQQSPMSGILFYNTLVVEPQYQKRILTPESLEEALLLIPDETLRLQNCFKEKTASQSRSRCPSGSSRRHSYFSEYQCGSAEHIGTSGILKTRSGRVEYGEEVNPMNVEEMIDSTLTRPFLRITQDMEIDQDLASEHTSIPATCQPSNRNQGRVPWSSLLPAASRVSTENESVDRSNLTPADPRHKGSQKDLDKSVQSPPSTIVSAPQRSHVVGTGKLLPSERQRATKHVDERLSFIQGEIHLPEHLQPRSHLRRTICFPISNPTSLTDKKPGKPRLSLLERGSCHQPLVAHGAACLKFAQDFVPARKRLNLESLDNS